MQRVNQYTGFIQRIPSEDSFRGPEDSFKGSELTTVSHVSPHQDPNGSAWKLDNDIQGEGEDRSSPTETDLLVFTFPLHPPGD